MSDSESERQRKLKAGRAKLMEFKQMKKRKKKEEAAASANAGSSTKSVRSASGSVRRESLKTQSHETSQAGDQDTENDATSFSSATGSQAGSPIPHDGSEVSYTSGSEYTSADESYSTDDGGVDSYVVANLERNELKNRVIELEENLRGKQAVLKEVNKENFELRAKLNNFESGSRQEASPSPILKRELDNLQETLRANQKKLEEINVENQEMRAKLAGNEDKSVLSKVEELKLSLESKQQMLEALNKHNEELVKENQALKVKSRDQSPDSSRSDSQIESLQENLKTKQSILTELNRQNQELREKLSASPSFSNDQIEKLNRKISDLQSELTLKDDELEKFKAIQVSFVQTKEVLKEVSLQSQQVRDDLELSQNRYLELQKDSEAKQQSLLARAIQSENQFEKLQSEYHSIVAINNDGLMKIQILESQIANINEELNKKDKKIREMDSQVSLAIGERDAVQLEAQTQVEDFEDRIKEMRDQMQRNDMAVKEYESKITSATEDLVKTKQLVLETQDMLEIKNNEITSLNNKVEVLQGSGDSFSNERQSCLEEIESLRSTVEEKQMEMEGVCNELDKVRKEHSEGSEAKDLIIAELEGKCIEAEKFHALQIESLESKYSQIIDKLHADSNGLVKDEKEKWELEMNEKLKSISDDYEASKREAVRLIEEKDLKIAELSENNTAEHNLKLSDLKEEISSDLRRKVAKIVELEELLAEKDHMLDSTFKELESHKTKNQSLEEEIAGLEDSILLRKPKLGAEEMAALRCGVLKENEELQPFLDKLALMNFKEIIEELISKEVLLHEDNNRMKEILDEKTGFENKTKAELSSLLEEKKLISSEMEELVENLDQLKNEKDNLEKSYEDSVQLNSSLKKEIEDLELVKRELSAENLQLLKSEEDNEKVLEEKIKNEQSLVEQLNNLHNDKEVACSEYNAEIGQLKERLELVSQEQNAETVALFNQNLAKLEAEKNEQIQTLKEEMAHQKESFEKQLRKLNSEYELDSKQVEDENQRLRLDLKTLKENSEREKASADSNHKIEIDKLTESHRLKLTSLSKDLRRRFEEEKLEFKESNWKQLKRFEAEREMEIRSLTIENEKRKELELDALREELEEEKQQEIHDVVCNMTREQKENAAMLRESFEEQLGQVQAQRDQELRNIKEEFQGFKERKKEEMEELLTSQIARYEEEQSTLQKRLNEAEEHVHMLTNERDVMVKDLATKSSFLEEDRIRYEEEKSTLQEKLSEVEERFHELTKERSLVENDLAMKNSAVEEEQLKYKKQQSALLQKLTEMEECADELRNERDILSTDLCKKNSIIEEEAEKRTVLQEELSMLKDGNNLLRRRFEETVSELGRLGAEKPDIESSLLQRDEVDAKVFSVEEGESQITHNESYERSERFLDGELRKVTKLCKRQIFELTEQLHAATARAEESEKKLDESSCLNESLYKEVEILKDELNNSRYEIDSFNEQKQSKFNDSDALKPEVVLTEAIDDTLLRNIQRMEEQVAQLSTEIELKKQQKLELDMSLTDIVSEIESAQSNKIHKQPIAVEEDIQKADVPADEAWILPEALQDLETTPLTVIEENEPEEAASLEVKHLQTMLFENNEKLDLQKQEIKDLQDELESERSLFAQQLRIRQAKENLLKSNNNDLPTESVIRENRDLLNKVMMLEQRLKEKETSEEELRDENWKLVNLLKDNNIELFTEKESLQEQLFKQEEIIQELQLQMSTSDVVTVEIQEAFGRQLAALHRQRDVLLDQLEQHKSEHQGFAKIVQEKAVLEDRLREERVALSEKLKQKEALEMELAAERAVLHEKIIELEKLRENLNGKEKLASELSDQRDDLRMELNAIEERLKAKEENLSIQRVELERELQQKDFELQKWEEDFRSRELEFMQSEEALRQNFGEVLESTRTNLENRFEESIGQLRSDLDADYMDRMHLLENGLHEQYGEEISRIKEDHQQQINRAKSGFEEKLLDLRRQLEEERLRQVGTVKSVLEREHSHEIMDLETGHNSEINELKTELQREHELEIDRLEQSFQVRHQNAIEELQSSLMTESAIQLAAARLQAEVDATAQVEKMQAEVDAQVDRKMRQMQSKQKRVPDKRTAKEQMDDVIREIKLRNSETVADEMVEDTTQQLQAQIKSLEEHLIKRHNEDLRQAEIDLAVRYEQEMDNLKYQITQRHGDDMFVVMSEFEAEQENYFKERLHFIQQEHESEMEQLSREQELVLLKTKHELEVLREEDFQRIRMLQDEIYAKEEAILELKIALNSEGDDVQKKVERKLSVDAKEILDKNENWQNNGDYKLKFEAVLKEKEEMEQDFNRRTNERIISELKSWQIEHDKEIDDWTEKLRVALLEKEFFEHEFDNKILEARTIWDDERNKEISDLRNDLKGVLMEKEFIEKHVEDRILDAKTVLEEEHNREIVGLRNELQTVLMEKAAIEHQFRGRNLDTDANSALESQPTERTFEESSSNPNFSEVDFNREILDLRNELQTVVREKELVEKHLEDRILDAKTIWEEEHNREIVDLRNELQNVLMEKDSFEQHFEDASFNQNVSEGELHREINELRNEMKIILMEKELIEKQFNERVSDSNNVLRSQLVKKNFEDKGSNTNGPDEELHKERNDSRNELEAVSIEKESIEKNLNERVSNPDEVLESELTKKNFEDRSSSPTGFESEFYKEINDLRNELETVLLEKESMKMHLEERLLASNDFSESQLNREIHDFRNELHHVLIEKENMEKDFERMVNDKLKSTVGEEERRDEYDKELNNVRAELQKTVTEKELLEKDFRLLNERVASYDEAAPARDRRGAMEEEQRRTKEYEGDKALDNLRNELHKVMAEKAAFERDFNLLNDRLNSTSYDETDSYNDNSALRSLRDELRNAIADKELLERDFEKVLSERITHAVGEKKAWLDEHDREISNLQAELQKTLVEKEMMEENFERILHDRVEEAIGAKQDWQMEHEQDIYELKTSFEKTMIEKECEHEEKFQELRSKYENQIVVQDIDCITKEEEVKLEVARVQWTGDEDQQSEIERLESLHEAQLGEQDKRHQEELEEAVNQLSNNLKADFNNIMLDIKSKCEAEKDDLRRELSEKEEIELQLLRRQLYSELEDRVLAIRNECEQIKLNEIAQVTTQLSLKNAVELENQRERISRKYEKELDAVKKEMQRDFSRNSLRQAAEIDDLESKHSMELRRVKQGYESKIAEMRGKDSNKGMLSPSNEVEHLKREHAAELKRTKADFEARLSEKRNREAPNDAYSHANEIEDLKMDHALELSRIKADFESRISELRNRDSHNSALYHSNEIEDLKMEHAAELRRTITEYEAKLADMRRSGSPTGTFSFSSEIEDIRMEHEAELRRTRADYESRIAELRGRETQRGLYSQSSEIEDLRREHAAEIKRTKEDYESLIAELKADDTKRGLYSPPSEVEILEMKHAEEMRIVKENYEQILKERSEGVSQSLFSDPSELKNLKMKGPQELTEIKLKCEQLLREKHVEPLAEEVWRGTLSEDDETELKIQHAEEIRKIKDNYEQILEQKNEQLESAALSNAFPHSPDIDDIALSATRRIKELEKKHTEELKKAKMNYDQALQEKTQEYETEINLLKSLLGGSEPPIIPVNEDFVDAKPPHMRSEEDIRKSNESVVYHPPGGNSLDVEDNATLASSTETLIARFADGHIDSALRDVQGISSSEGGSRFSSSLGGSAPNLFHGSGHDVPRWEHAGEYRHEDQVRREQDEKLFEMRRRFRSSGSDSSGKSYDQLMEAPMTEEDERIMQLLHEKDEELRDILEKKREEYDRAYLGKIQDLERECMQFENNIHMLNYQHQEDIKSLKEKSLKLAEQSIKEIREEVEKEKEMVKKEEETKLKQAQEELASKHENLLQKFVKQQKKEMMELREDHIEELAMLKHELNTKHEQQMKEYSEKQGIYVLETREKYERLLKGEKEKAEKRHAEDVRKIRQAMDHDLGDKDKDMLKMARENYEADLRQLRERLEEENRKVIDDLTKDHLAEMGRAKETHGREMEERFRTELRQMVEQTRQETEREHMQNLRLLEYRLEDTHIQNLHTLQEIREKHKSTIEDLKREHQKEIEKLKDENEDKMKQVKSELQGEHVDQIHAVDLSVVTEMEKAKKDMEEAHKKETEELQNELNISKARIVALEAMKSGTETTYMNTINSLQEDYENEISKLKSTVDKIKLNQIENLDKTHSDVHSTDQRIMKQNFEQQLSQMKHHYELLMDEMERNFEQQKKDALQQQVEKYEKKMKEVNDLYEEDRSMLTDGITQIGEEHVHELNLAKEQTQKWKSEVQELEKKCKQLTEENTLLTNKKRITDDQYETLVARHERQEQENAKYISMLSSDVEKCEHEKTNFKRNYDRLVQLLSDVVRASMITEESINHHLDGLIQETSRAESGVDISGFGRAARRLSPERGHSPDRSGRKHSPERDRGFKSFFSFRKSPKKDKSAHGSTFNDATQYSNISGGSLLSDEGLERSFLTQEILFQGHELDHNTEEMIRGVGERLHTAVEHVLKMLSMSTKQATGTRQSVDEMLSKSRQSEEEQREIRERITEELKTALENLEKEKKSREQWEKEARKKHSDHESRKKELKDLKDRIETLEKERSEKDSALRKIEDKLFEVETEKDILGKLKHDLELKLAEVKTHSEKDSHGLKQQNEELKKRLERAVQLSGDEFDQVVNEIEDLKDHVSTLSEEKDALRSQVKDAKHKLNDRGEENERLRENISEVLQSNIELIQQNETLKGKILSLESAFEETLQEQKTVFDTREASTIDNDFIDGRLDTVDAGNSHREMFSLKKEISNLKEHVNVLKQENDNLANNLEEKVENELELLNKISELENELYKSCNEGFETDRYDVERLLRDKKNAEAKFKVAVQEKEKLEKDFVAAKEELMAVEKDMMDCKEELLAAKDELVATKEDLKNLENDLTKAKEQVVDRNSLYDELMKFKSVILTKDEEASKAKRDAEVVSLALSDKDEEISVISSELSELKETVEEQQSTINEQHEKIVNLLQKQASDELNQQYIQELEVKIKQEKEHLLVKDGEIQILLERLSKENRSGDVRSAEASPQKVEELEEKIREQEVEMRRLATEKEAVEKERQQLEQTHEINLQKALHHVRKEMEKANKLRIAKLKEEHQTEIDRILEMSKLDYSDLGERFEEQVGAAERVNLHILEHFFKNRGMNESNVAVEEDGSAPVQSLLKDLQSEAQKIAQLVISYDTPSNESGNVEELQLAWAKERQVLLEAVKALRQLVARASHTAAVDSTSSGEDWRSELLGAVEEVFKQEHGILSAEIDSLESIPSSTVGHSDLISKKKQQLENQDEFYKKVLQSLVNKDRESLIAEIVHFSRMVDDLQGSVEHYQNLLEDFQNKAEMREQNLARQFDSQMSLIELERSSASELKAQLESEINRNSELELLLKREQENSNDLKAALSSEGEKKDGLVSSLENERSELRRRVEDLESEKEMSDVLLKALQVEKQQSEDLIQMEKSKVQNLEKTLKEETEKNNQNTEMINDLTIELKQSEDLAQVEKSNVGKLEKKLSEETKRNKQHTEMINDLTVERNRLEEAAEVERNHMKKIEDLCQELKAKTAHEKSERQRLEKIAERYHGNLEEMSKLFESEKQRRVDNEKALSEQRKYRVEAEEKWQTEETEKVKLEDSLSNAKNDIEGLKRELSIAQEKISNQEAEIQSDNAIRLAELEKQHAEKVKESIDRVKRNAADEVERERATCVQLRDALKSLQLKYETSRSQLERMKDSMDEREGNQPETEAKAQTSPTSRHSVSSRVMDPFINRCTKLIVKCQEAISTEQRRLKYSTDRPSTRHIKELQATHDSLAALSHEVNDLQQDLRALEQGDHTSTSPLARLEQAHNKNEELRDHIRKLVAEKSELRNTLKSLEEQVMQYRSREAELEEAASVASEEARLALKTEQMKWKAEREAIEQALDMASIENANLRNGQMKPETEASEESSKLGDSGWTLPKIQKLYGRCLRAESFRKALIYQKKYLLFLLGGFQETEAITLSMIAKMDGNSDNAGKAQYGKSRAFMRFRTAARVVIATWRMKFLVKKWNRSVSRAGGKAATRKSTESKVSPSAPPSAPPIASEKTTSFDRFYMPKQTNFVNGDSSDSSSRRNRQAYHQADRHKSETDRHKSRDINSNVRKHSRHHGYELHGKTSKENGHVTRKERQEPLKMSSDHLSYSSVRNLDSSPPRAYPRPASPRLNRDSPPVLDTDSYGHHQSSRTRSGGPSPKTIDAPEKHRRSLSASGLEETNTSLNAYIKKLESLQARLKSQ